MAYGAASKIFGLELKTLLSNCERHHLKRFLLTCLLSARRRDETTCRWNSRLQSLLVSILFSVYQNDQFPTSLFILSRDVTRLAPQSFQWSCKKHLHLSLFSVVLTGKLTNYDVTKPSSDNFPKFTWTVPFVTRRKIAVFKVEYLGRFLTKSCKTLDYDYLDYYLLF